MRRIKKVGYPRYRRKYRYATMNGVKFRASWKQWRAMGGTRY